MDDKEQITKLYHDMYAAMVAKDEAELKRVHDESFVLIHMTGMHQSKQEYIGAIMDGILNYYSEQTDSLTIDIKAKGRLAKKSLDLGFHISISGIVTFKKAEELQEIVKFVPLDRLLIETDAPFLAPTPFRGKINEPAYVSYTAQKISEILNLPLEKIAAQTSENFFKLFQKASK